MQCRSCLLTKVSDGLYAWLCDQHHKQVHKEHRAMLRAA